MNKLLLSTGILFLISGCATGPQIPREKVELFQPKAEVQYVPELNVPVTAEIGDTLISRSYVKKIPAIKIKNGIKHSFLSNSNFIIPEGTLAKYATGNMGVYYSSSDFKGFIGGKSLQGGVLLENEGAKNVNKIYFQLDPLGFHYSQNMVGSVEVEVVKPVEINSEDNFRRELIYTGVSKNVITLIYREFKNDMARPAFSQELKYDLSEGSDIGFKGARFQVLNATNLGIKYKVLKNWID